jgi:polysaccharide deacetylase 2 family uncharacterized protein YibQ
MPEFSDQAVIAARWQQNRRRGGQVGRTFLKIVLFTLEVGALSASVGTAALLATPLAARTLRWPQGVAGKPTNVRGTHGVKLSRAVSPVRQQRAGRRRAKALVAIVMDDLGPDVAATRQAILLPPAITMSFLPYAHDVAELARAARARGHEVIVHVPMQPLGPEDPGPGALRVDLSAVQNRRRLSWDLSRVPGADGINSHMGSRFTADRAALVPVLGLLSRTGYFFLDSRTTAKTQVVPLARTFGILSAGRDVFLDDIQRREYVLRQLRQLLRLAERNGVAIAIGHPHPVTLQAVQWWIAHHPGLHLIKLRTALRLKAHGTRLRTAGRIRWGD